MFTDKVINAQVTPTIDDDAYTANDVVGGLMTFNVASPSMSGIINKVKITDADNEGAALDLYIFSAVPSTIADDAAGALVIADLDKLVCKVEVAAADYEAVNSLKFAVKEDINAVYTTDTGNLYMYAICTGTPTYASAALLKFTITVLTS